MPPIDVQCVGAVKVFSYLQLSVVANITSLPYEFIKELNPQFVEGYVPESSQGYNVILPRRVMSALQDYAANPDAQQQAAMHFAPVVVDETLPTLEGEPSYYLTNYMVGDGETLENIADLFNVGVYNILLWNHLDSDKVEKGKELILYLPRVVPKRV